MQIVFLLNFGAEPDKYFFFTNFLDKVIFLFFCFLNPLFERQDMCFLHALVNIVTLFCNKTDLR